MALFNLVFSDALFLGLFDRHRWAVTSALGVWLWLLAGLAPTLAQTTTADSTTTNPRRAGSTPTQPVRNISLDRNAPQSPPPPGVKNTGQPSVVGASRKAAPSLTPDSTGLLADTSRRVRDSLNLVVLKRRSPVETTVKYAAKDSIQFDVTSKIAKLYTKSTVDYGPMSLKAALITVNYGTNTVQAAGRRDTIKNKMEGVPLFKDADGTYSAGAINYNFKSKKGKISEVVTQQGEGYIHAEVVKKLPDNEIYGLHGRYTTCNLAHPHFYIEAGKMKVIPGQKVITGPFHMVIADVPLPIGLPFGYFPTPHNGRGSGFIIPTFGQGAQRGYSLTNGGYYWAPNDYIGLRVTGDIYAGNADRFGGWGLASELTYRKRYKYQGSFRFTYAQQPTTATLNTTTVLNENYAYPTSVNTFWISWSHTPTPLPGGGVFSASVQAGSSSYNRVNTLNARQLLSAAFNSTISYSKTSRRLPINYTVQLAQSQNVTTGVMDFTLPNLNLGVARQYPYQWFGIQPSGKFYEQFAISYNLVAQNRISSLVPARSLSGDIPLLGGSSTSYSIPVSFRNINQLLRNAQNGLQHQFQITLPSATVLGRHIQIQPSVNYGETWYAQRLQYAYLPTVRAVKVDTIPSFNRAYSYSANLAATTNFYGLVQIKGNHFIKAVRHKVTPSVTYSFSPDLSNSSAFEFSRSTEYNDLRAANNGRILDPTSFSRYQGFVYGTPTSRLVNQIGLSIQNSIEMKVRNNRDTTGNDPYRKVSLADGIDVSLAYNFGSGKRDERTNKPIDSLKLSNLNLGYRVQIAKKLNVVATSSFSFYQRDSTGRLINRYLFDQEGILNRRIARLLSANLSLGYQFNPAAKPKSKANIPRAVAPANDPVLGSPAPQAIYADYIDFDIPWEATVQYTASYTAAAAPIRPTLLGATPLLSGSSVTASGSVKLTPNLRLSTTLNYNFSQNQFVYPTVNFYRDLHCWQISGLWIPVGTYRGYQFTIAAKSSLLQDLKLNRNKTILNR